MLPWAIPPLKINKAATALTATASKTNEIFLCMLNPSTVSREQSSGNIALAAAAIAAKKVEKALTATPIGNLRPTPIGVACRLERWKTKLWANGEVTIGLVPLVKKKTPQEVKRYKKDWHEFNEFISNGDGTRRIESYSWNNQGETLGQVLKKRAEKAEKRERKGKKGITGYGARVVRNGCHILEKHYGRSRLAMVTPTLPNVPEYLPLWVSVWPELVRKYLQEVQRELKRNDAPTELIGVTEIHPKRSIEAGYTIPHLHFIHVAWSGYRASKKDPRDWYITADRHREMWKAVLINATKQAEIYNPEIEMPLPRVNTEIIKKSAEGYLGKYMSKGAKSLQTLKASLCDMSGLPSHWWHCSKKLRAVIKGAIRELPTDILTAILQKVDLVSRKVAYYMREIKREVGDSERLFGYYLKLSSRWHKLNKTELIHLFNTA